MQLGYQQAALDNFISPHSAYSYVDFPSDNLGAEFGANYFDEASPLNLGQQVKNFFDNKLNPLNLEAAPNFKTMPGADSKNPPSVRNGTTDPIYLRP